MSYKEVENQVQISKPTKVRVFVLSTHFFKDEDDPYIILLWLMAGYFTQQGEICRKEKVSNNALKISLNITKYATFSKNSSPSHLKLHQRSA